ncbi:MAG: folate-binding protein YgfZ [Gemmatimonadaceae bacterium]|nr:folate-binding protein YgfZ [Gemmatimonadaceae bacterium]
MTESPSPHESSSATRLPSDDRSAVGLPEPRGVGNFGDVEGEYWALRRGDAPGAGGAIVVDRSDRSRGTFAGGKAREVLTGLVTNDVLSLQPGTGCYAAALTAKGKILADVRIFVRDDDVLVDVPPRASAGWWTMVRKYVNPRLSRYADVSAETADLSVYGTRAHAVVAGALGLEWESLQAMDDFAHRAVESHGHTILVARVPDLGLEGFALLMPTLAQPAVWSALVSHGARAAGRDAVHIARVESGRPEWGVEMDDSTLAQEANMEELHAISFTKGCYTGQETVARVHFRGRVNRHLRGLRFDEARPVSVGAELHDAAGKVMGDVRSVAISPRLGGIALAMVRREVEMDTDIDVVWGDARGRARVVTLPFPPG